MNIAVITSLKTAVRALCTRSTVRLRSSFLPCTNSLYSFCLRSKGGSL